MKIEQDSNTNMIIRLRQEIFMQGSSELSPNFATTTDEKIFEREFDKTALGFQIKFSYNRQSFVWNIFRRSISVS